MTIPGPLGRKSKILDTSKVSVRLELTGINRLLCEVTGAESGCEYAFYVMKDNEVIDKIPYQGNNRYVYWPTDSGVYSVKVFVRSGADGRKTTFTSEKVGFNGFTVSPVEEGDGKEKSRFCRMRDNVRSVVKEIVTHRERMYRISRYDYRVLNKDAYLGNIWNLLNPLIQIATYWFVFGFGIRGGKDVDGFPYIIWMLCGMIPWFYLSAGITQGAGAIRNKGIAVLKMRYPVATIPLEQMLVQFYSHIMMVAFLMITLLCMGCMPSLYWLNLIYYFAYGIVFLTSLSMITSVLCMIAVDFQKLIQSTIRLLFYLTPILWSLDQMPPAVGRILSLNPILYYVNGFRDSLIYHRAFYEEPRSAAFFWMINALLFVCGCNLIAKYRDKFIDMQ